MASQIKVNEIIKQSGSSISIGESGDTINIGTTGDTINLAGSAYAAAGTNTPSFFARASTDQDISDAVTTKVQFNDEIFDTDSAYDAVNDKFVVPSGEQGKYLFMYSVDCHSKAASELEIADVYFYKNGSAVNEQSSDFRSNPVRRFCATNTIILDLSAGDYIEVYGKVDDASGTPKFTGDVAYTTYFAGFKLT